MLSADRGDRIRFCSPFQEQKMGKLLVDLHLRLARNRAKQKQLDKRLLLRKKDNQA